MNKKIYMLTDLKGTLVAYHIIGVIKDFNFNSLRDQVAPMVLNLQQDNRGMAVRISTHDIWPVERNKGQMELNGKFPTIQLYFPG